jgi:TolB protein
MQSRPPVAALVLLALLALAAPAQASFPGRNGRIAVTSWSNSTGELGGAERSFLAIRALRPFGRGDGRALRSCSRSTEHPPRGDCSTDLRSPAYAPGGRRIAFDAGERLAIMAADGSGLRLLAQHTPDDGEPAFSPDGRRLVFSGGPAGAGAGARRLYVAPVAGGPARAITGTGASEPAWSVRNRIAFTRRGNVRSVRPDGGGLRLLTHRGGRSPDWSPDGRRIAFVRKRTIRIHDLRTGLVRWIAPSGGASPPANVCWSPDGRYLAFESFEGNIWTVGARGRRLRQRVEGQYSSSGSHGSTSPAWQPLPR